MCFVAAVPKIRESNILKSEWTFLFGRFTRVSLCSHRYRMGRERVVFYTLLEETRNLLYCSLIPSTGTVPDTVQVFILFYSYIVQAVPVVVSSNKRKDGHTKILKPSPPKPFKTCTTTTTLSLSLFVRLDRMSSLFTNTLPYSLLDSIDHEYFWSVFQQGKICVRSLIVDPFIMVYCTESTFGWNIWRSAW